MTDKTLKNKAVKIKNKDYVLVADRVVYFNDNYPNGCIKTSVISDVSSDRVVVRAVVIPDVKNSDRFFVGHAQEVIGDGYINKTSALENAETSAVGRALAMMGIGVIESIASVDEIRKAENNDKEWLTEDKFNAMKKTIEMGGCEKVIDAMKRYKMKKVWRDELNKLLSSNNVNYS